MAFGRSKRTVASRLKDLIGFNPVGWIRWSRRMRAHLADYMATARVGEGNPKGGVLVTPWLGSGVPFFALVLGLLMSNRGAAITFIFDEHRFGPQPWRHGAILRFLRPIMALVAKRHRVLTVRREDDQGSSPLDEATVSQLSRWNATWALRGEMTAAGRERYAAESEAQLIAAAIGARRILASNDFDFLLLPSGIYGISSVWYALAAREGTRCATYDAGGYETVMVTVDGIACQLQDIPRAVAALTERSRDNPSEGAFIIGSAQAEIDKRRAGIDDFESQMPGSGPADRRAEGAVLMALNSSWDTAALGPHRVFSDSREWIVETARFILDNSDRSVIIRQHPAERLEIGRTSDDYATFVREHFAGDPRVILVAAEDPVNSYDLLRRSAFVIVHTSTIGLEATIAGKPVVTPSSAYYAGQGFVWAATDREAYHRLLRDALAGTLAVSNKQVEDALRCYYAAQCCNWVFSKLNPTDFPQWHLHPVAEWEEDAKVSRMIEAILSDTPVALLNHESRWAATQRIEATS